MSLPQSLEEEKLMDKTIWDFMMTKAANNMSYLIEEVHTITIFISAESEFVPEDSVGSKLADLGIDVDSREAYYAPNGKLDFYQSWTNEKLRVHREGFLLEGIPLHITELCFLKHHRDD